MIEQEGAAPGKGAAPEDCGQPQHQETESGRTGAGEQTDWKDLPLDAEHVAMLVASGITPEQARLRGYQTISVWTGDACTISGSHSGLSTEPLVC